MRVIDVNGTAQVALGFATATGHLVAALLLDEAHRAAGTLANHRRRHLFLAKPQDYM